MKCSCKWEWSDWSVAHRMPKHTCNHEYGSPCEDDGSLLHDSAHSQAYASSLEKWLSEQHYDCAMVGRENIVDQIDEMSVDCLLLYRGTLSEMQRAAISDYCGKQPLNPLSRRDWALAFTGSEYATRVLFVRDTAQRRETIDGPAGDRREPTP